MRRSHLRMHLHDCRADSALGVQAAVGARVTIIRACWRLHVLISPAQICRRDLFGRFYAAESPWVAIHWPAHRSETQASSTPTILAQAPAEQATGRRPPASAGPQRAHSEWA